jgi:Fibrinogen beta and gamma chains, C-terminal globular domain
VTLTPVSSRIAGDENEFSFQKELQIGFPGASDVLTVEGELDVSGSVAAPATAITSTNVQVTSLTTADLSLTGSVNLTGSLTLGMPKGGLLGSCDMLNQGEFGFLSRAGPAELMFCDGRFWRFVKSEQQVPTTDPYGLFPNNTGFSCQDILEEGGYTKDGVYWVDLDGPGAVYTPMPVWCDMTTDDGGWTLVFRDAQDGGMVANQPASISTAAVLATGPDGPVSAKMSDAIINTLKGSKDTRQTYRLTGLNITSKYFAPGACVFTHSPTKGKLYEATCRRFSSTYDPNFGPTYQQCDTWSDNEGGLNFWFGCTGTAQSATNVAVTHRQGFPTVADMVENPSGGALGSAANAPRTRVSVWVR